MRFSKKTIATGTIAIGLATFRPAIADTPVIEIEQALHKEGVNDGIGVTWIDVTGSGSDRYDKVATQTLQFWVVVKDRKPANAVRYSYLKLRVADTAKEFSAPSVGTRGYALSAPYTDPRGAGTDLPYSPVDLCTAELARRSGAERDSFLQQGGSLPAAGAYRIDATAAWLLASGGLGFKEDQLRQFQSSVRATAIIRCRPLSGPKVRTDVRTQGASPKHGKRWEPVLETTSFKIEPYQSEIVASQQCPSRLRLYGFVKVRRAFAGKLIFFGPHYLSPVSELTFDQAGQRTVVDDYHVKWGGMHAKATSGKMSQLVSLRMNITDTDNDVLGSVPRGIQLSCKPVDDTPPIRATP